MNLTVNSTYRTRGGEKAKLLSKEASPVFPLVVEIGEGAQSRIVRLRAGGTMLAGGMPHTDDLIAPWRKTPVLNQEVYINVYAEHDGLNKFNRVFRTLKGANKKAAETGDNRIGVVRARLTEVEFLPL